MEKRFSSPDKPGLDQQLWAWRNDHPQFKVTKIHAIEDLPLKVVDSRPWRIIEAIDCVAMRIEYEEAP
jgi:hypothetical protein